MKTKFKILQEGGPIINEIHILERVRNIILLEGDLKSKWCRYGGYCCYGNPKRGPSVFIDPTESSLYLNKRKKSASTEIELVDFPGWQPWAVEVSRYSIFITLYKEKK